MDVTCGWVCSLTQPAALTAVTSTQSPSSSPPAAKPSLKDSQGTGVMGRRHVTITSQCIMDAKRTSID